MADIDYYLPSEPQFFAEEQFKELMLHAYDLGASDITIQSEEPVKIQLHGRIRQVTRRALNDFEIEGIVSLLYGSNGVGRLKDGKDIDCSYIIRLGTKKNIRFRINITPCYAYGLTGCQITARTINSKPLTPEQMRIEQAILDAFYPEEGLVLVCGGTGSGKSTTLSGMMAHKISQPGSNIKLITGESPIEYVYDDIEKCDSSVAQSEVPTHLPNFAAVVRNALRRAPDYILIGESRDLETIESTLEASETGHTVYSTVHSDSVHGTLYRLVNTFPSEERSTKLYEIIEQLRLIVVQRLLKKKGGGRIACREYLVFNQDIRDRLRSCSEPREAVNMVKELTRLYGKSTYQSAQELFNADLIEPDEFEVIAAIERAMTRSNQS